MYFFNRRDHKIIFYIFIINSIFMTAFQCMLLRYQVNLNFVIKFLLFSVILHYYIFILPVIIKKYVLKPLPQEDEVKELLEKKLIIERKIEQLKESNIEVQITNIGKDSRYQRQKLIKEKNI
jgi:hypothetical protein